MNVEAEITAILERTGYEPYGDGEWYAKVPGDYILRDLADLRRRIRAAELRQRKPTQTRRGFRPMTDGIDYDSSEQ